MCLVSLIVLEDKIVLTSNRDEAPSRAAIEIQQETINGKNVIYPADNAGGSWVFCSDQGDIICLLNGAFELHQRTLPYKMSRGLVMKAFFEYDDPVDFLQYFDFENIEPFTMIIVSDGKRLEYRWDGHIKHVKELYDMHEYVWSSSTLYDSGTQEMRQEWFQKEREQFDDLDKDSIVEIHLNGGRGNKDYGFVMNRKGIVRTISLTQVVLEKDIIKMRHQDLTSDMPFIVGDLQLSPSKFSTKA